MPNETNERETGTAIAESPIPKLTEEQLAEAKKALEEACANLPPPREDVYAYAAYCRQKEPERIGEFCCPLCGSKEYQEKTSNNGIFDPECFMRVEYYICTGCTVHFSDPKKFTHALDHSLKEPEETSHD